MDIAISFWIYLSVRICVGFSYISCYCFPTLYCFNLFCFLGLNSLVSLTGSYTEVEPSFSFLVLLKFIYSDTRSLCLFLLFEIARITIKKFGSDFINLTIDKFEPETLHETLITLLPPSPKKKGSVNPEKKGSTTSTSGSKGESSSPSSSASTTKTMLTTSEATATAASKNISASVKPESTVQPTSGVKNETFKKQNRTRRDVDDTNPTTTLVTSEVKPWPLAREKINVSASEYKYSGNVSVYIATTSLL